MNRLSIKEQIILTLFNGTENNVIPYRPLSYIYNTLPEVSSDCVRVTTGILLSEGSIEKIEKHGFLHFTPTKTGLKSLFGKYLYNRVYAPETAEGGILWNRQYHLIVFKVPEVQRKKRGRIRELLLRHGFRLWQEGLWLSPVPDKNLTKKLQSENLDQYISFVLASKIELPQKIAKNQDSVPEQKWPFSLWNLSGIRNSYSNLVREGQRLSKKHTFDVVGYGNFLKWQEKLLLNMRKDPFFPENFFDMSDVRERTLTLFVSLSRKQIL